MEDILLRELLEESLGLKSVLAARFGFTMEVRMEGPPVMLHGNWRLLRAAIGNMIDSAIKSNRCGKRVLVVQRADGGEALISVLKTEDGDEAKSARHEGVFRDKTHMKRKAGLADESPGMSLANRVARLHGGRIVGDGEEGSLTIYLPLGC